MNKRTKPLGKQGHNVTREKMLETDVYTDWSYRLHAIFNNQGGSTWK